jgi:hypothetical protein
MPMPPDMAELLTRLRAKSKPKMKGATEKNDTEKNTTEEGQ